MLLNIDNKADDIVNEKIIRRAIDNNDFENIIFKNLNDFLDHGSREETGYYERIYYTISNSLPMVSSELYNEEDGNMDVSHQLPLPDAEVYKSLPYNSKPVSNIKGTDRILLKKLY